MSAPAFEKPKLPQDRLRAGLTQWEESFTACYVREWTLSNDAVEDDGS